MKFRVRIHTVGKYDYVHRNVFPQMVLNTKKVLYVGYNIYLLFVKKLFL